MVSKRKGEIEVKIYFAEETVKKAKGQKCADSTSMDQNYKS